MGLKDTRSKAIECLKAGWVQAAERSDINEKNLLKTGVVTPEEVFISHILLRKLILRKRRKRDSMEIFKEKDKSRAICSHCKKQVTTTFQVRTSSIKDGGASYKVPDILVGVCDVCDSVVSVPQQSFAAVAEVRKKAEKETMDFRVPRHLLDVLNNSILVLGVETSSDLRSQLLRLYMASMSENPKQSEKLKRNLKSELLQGTFKRSNRLSMKVNSQLETRFAEIRKVSGMNKTEVIDSLIVEVKHDILDKKNPTRFDEIKRALLATG